MSKKHTTAVAEPMAPTAARLEGLLAALRCLPGSPSDLRRRIASAADAGINFLLDAQVTSGRCAGGLPRVPPAVDANDINDRRRRTEVRIDYVQHALSAFLQYRYLATEPFVSPSNCFDPCEAIRVDASWF